jgi:invasion protein IalB
VRHLLTEIADLTGQIALIQPDFGSVSGRQYERGIFMNTRNAPAPAQLAGRTPTAFGHVIGFGRSAIKTALLSAVLATASASIALAQQPPAPPVAPAAKPKPAPAAKPKPAAQPPAAQQQPVAPPEAQQQQAQGADQQVQLIFSPWTKFCLKANQQDPNSKQVCFTGKDARIESGMPVVAAVLIEPEGEPKKILRVTLPLGMQLVHGTRLIIDQNQPMTAPYVICFTNGCMADYEATPDMVAKMKKGQNLVVQAINSTAQPITLGLPLADFAKAYDGPPTDPKVFEEQQKKLQEELQRRADEARKKLEQQQGGAPQSSNAPPQQ